MSGLHLDDYHQGVARWLAAKFDWLQSVECYPEVDKPDTPCAFFAVMGWLPDQHQPGNGQLSVMLECQVLLVVGKDCPENQQYARNMAMACCAGLQNSNFDLPVSPAKVISADPYGFEPELDAYVVWSVVFQQKVTVGSSVFRPEPVRSGIRFAINPVDPSQAEAYQPLREKEVNNAAIDRSVGA